jgi:ABC-type transporter Mla subunit MlaD
MITYSKSNDRKDIELVITTLYGDFADIKVNTTIDAIDKWIDFLNGHKDEHSKEISDSLKELKKLLKGQNSDAAEISKLLSKLGERTTALGDDAAHDVKRSMHNLGKVLTTFSRKIEQSAKVN